MAVQLFAARFSGVQRATAGVLLHQVCRWRRISGSEASGQTERHIHAPFGGFPEDADRELTLRGSSPQRHNPAPTQSGQDASCFHSTCHRCPSARGCSCGCLCSVDSYALLYGNVHLAGSVSGLGKGFCVWLSPKERDSTLRESVAYK